MQDKSLYISGLEPITELPPTGVGGLIDPSIVTTDRTLRSSDVTFLALLMILGAGLRFYRIDTGLWFDEIQTLLDSVRSPLGRIISHFPSNNDHPLYSVLAHISVALFGEEPWSLRLPSALFGVAAIPMLYLLGIAVTDRREAAAASLILTVSYHHIWFSQNARGYTALLFCVLLATYALVQWFETGRKSFLILYAGITALGSYAHLTMVLVCLSHALVCGIDWLSNGHSRVRAEWRVIAGGFIGAGLLTVLLYAPMVADVSSFFTTSTVSTGEVATPIWAMVSALRGLQVGFGTMWGIAIGGVVFVAGAWSYFRERPTVSLLFLLPLPVTVILALALNRPIFPRFLFFAVGCGLLVTVRGASAVGALTARFTLGRLAPQRAATVMVALLTLGAVLLSIRSLPYGYRFPKQDYEQAVAFVERTKNDADIAAVTGEPAVTPVLQYLGRPWRRVDDGRQLRELRAAGVPVWVLYTFPSYIEAGQPELWTILRNECVEISEFEGTVAGGTISVRRCP